MTDMILLGSVFLIILYGMLRRESVYEAFTSGATEGLKSAVSILPNLLAMMIAVALWEASGLMDALKQVLSPILGWMNIPSDAAPMMLIRPLSGSGAMAVLEDILQTCGPDSRAGMVASTLMGSSETIFYTMGIYMSAAKVSKSRWALPAALLGWLVGSWTAGQFF